MADLGSRIRQVLQDKGLSQAELARLVGVKQQTISYICAPNSIATTTRYLSAIARSLGVNPAWLASGTGDKHDPSVRIEVDGKELTLKTVPLVHAEQIVAFLSKKKAKERYMTMMTDTKVSATAFAFEISDTSMTPEFRPGDRIVIDPELKPEPGDFVAAQHGGVLVFRKYRVRSDQHFDLVPLNNDWPVLDHRQAKVIGVMAEHRSYRKRN